MKRFLLPVIALLAGISAMAQEKPSAEEMNNRFFEAKVREFVYRLEITKAQEDDFTALLGLYEKDMRDAVGAPVHKHGARPEKKEGGKKDLTVEEVSARIKARMERQQKAQQVRLDYVDKFAKVLNAKQLNKFFEVEKKIQDKLTSRKDHPKGGRDGKRKGGHRPPRD